MNREYSRSDLTHERCMKARDRDIHQDVDGRIFTALGYIQPRDRVLSFLKYCPDPKGRWISGNKRYRRVFWGGVNSVLQAEVLLPKEYFLKDSHFGEELLEVPKNRIQICYPPEMRLREIQEFGPADRLETMALQMAERIHDTLHIPFDCIGVAGSIAWNAHNPNLSDINMNVYGYENSWKLQYGYGSLADENPDITLRLSNDWVSSKERLLSRSPDLTMNDLAPLFSRKKAVYLEEQCIGVTPILLPNESPINHSDESYHTENMKPITLKLEVTNADYGLFLPSVVHVKPLVKQQARDSVKRLMIYEGAFRGLLEPGDSIEACGMLQRVEVHHSDRNEVPSEFYQLMVGTKIGRGREYIRLLKHA